MNNIIIAQSTPIGLGALAIIRISGNNVRQFLDCIVTLKSNKKLMEVSTHTVHYGIFKDENNNIIDQVIVSIMDAPRSFTGENTAEITCHNNQFIIKNIIKRCFEVGARIANRGEFTERAVVNKKIDIFQAEAINELLHAQNEIITKTALSQLEGSLSSEVKKLDDSLSIIAAWCQASFEFLDEERDFRHTIKEKVQLVFNQIQKLLYVHEYSKIIKNGIKISIIGSVNVGKSSLLNCLIGYKRAIVSNVAGTTRDTIEASFKIDNYNVTFIDTAGIREAKDEIEKEGIEKSYFEMRQSDIILIVFTDEVIQNKIIFNFYNTIMNENNNKIILVKNKIDISNNKNFYDNVIGVSTIQGIGIADVIEGIRNKIENKYHGQSSSFIINSRHVENLNSILTEINSIFKMLNFENPLYEIILYHVFQAQKVISDLSGKTIEEKSFDRVFREFCVGK